MSSPDKTAKIDVCTALIFIVAVKIVMAKQEKIWCLFNFLTDQMVHEFLENKRIMEGKNPFHKHCSNC